MSWSGRWRQWRGDRVGKGPSRRRICRRLKELWRGQGGRQRLIPDLPRRILLLAGPVGVRQNDDVTAARGVRRAGRGGTGASLGRDGEREAAVRAQGLDGFPELRPLSPSHCGSQRRLRAGTREDTEI